MQNDKWYILKDENGVLGWEGLEKEQKNSHAIPHVPQRIKSCWIGGEALRGYSQILPAGFIGQAQEWWVKRQDFYKQKWYSMSILYRN